MLCCSKRLLPCRCCHYFSADVVSDSIPAILSRSPVRRKRRRRYQETPDVLFLAYDNGDGRAFQQPAAGADRAWHRWHVVALGPAG